MPYKSVTLTIYVPATLHFKFPPSNFSNPSIPSAGNAISFFQLLSVILNSALASNVTSIDAVSPLIVNLFSSVWPQPNVVPGKYNTGIVCVWVNPQTLHALFLPVAVSSLKSDHEP